MASGQAEALWISAVGEVELRKTPYNVSDGELEVKTRFTAISRGTERLVFNGNVPPGEHETMRAPFQDGGFSFPVKYGYAAVGEVQGPDRAGQLVFALFPHQTRFAVPVQAAVPVPAGVPAERAVLAANMETALNIVWDAGVGPGDKVAVVGAGVVGTLVGYLCAYIPGTNVCLVDIDAAKASLARGLGCDFATPDTAEGEADVVIHTSASSDGLATAISLAGLEAAIVEASWYGTQMTTAPLGGRFHQRRLRIISSQVGRIPAGRGARWDYRRRLETALRLLSDPVLDALISGESDFSTLADDYGAILRDPSTLCHRVRYVQDDAE